MAAMEAELAASQARDAASAPAPLTPTAPTSPAAPVEPLVTVNSLPPDSVVGEYRIDMASLDRNADGRLTRREASPNATLTAEFRAVDVNGDGMLDSSELKGWMR
jgi:hypothetical protein